MRVVHLNTMMGYYGGEVHLVDLAAGLKANGNEVCCVVRPGSGLLGHLQEKGVAVKVMSLTGWFDPFSVTRLRHFLQEFRCEILHTHLPRDYYLAACSTLGTSVRNVGTRHLLRPISLPGLKRPLFARFAGFIAVSEAVRRGFLQGSLVPAENVTVVPNGLDLAQDDGVALAVSPELRHQLGLAGEGPILGFVGRLCPTKGVATLIKAVARLKERFPGLKVCLVGDEAPGTGYRQDLQTLVSELDLQNQVIFAGYVDLANRIFSAFDIQVVPSIAEPFGLVTLEAMAAGIPVVVTNSGGSPEIVRDGQEGFLFAPGDVDGLAAKLATLLTSPGLRLEMGTRGRQRMLECFSSARMYEQTEAVYRRVLA